MIRDVWDTLFRLPLGSKIWGINIHRWHEKLADFDKLNQWRVQPSQMKTTEGERFVGVIHDRRIETTPARLPYCSFAGNQRGIALGFNLRHLKVRPAYW